MEQRSGGHVRLYLPAFGIVDAVLGFALFYFMAGLATVVAVDALAVAAPDLVPEPLSTWAAIACWVMLGLALVGIVGEQVRSNPRRFDSPADRARYLDRVRPDERRYLWWASWVAVGGAVAFATFGGFVFTFAALVRFLLAVFVGPVPRGPPATFLDAVTLVAFFLGYSLMTRGLDRLVVGTGRALVADWYGDEEA